MSYYAHSMLGPFSKCNIYGPHDYRANIWPYNYAIC